MAQERTVMARGAHGHLCHAGSMFWRRQAACVGKRLIPSFCGLFNCSPRCPAAV
jgi:hypothetical protein